MMMTFARILYYSFKCHAANDHSKSTWQNIILTLGQFVIGFIVIMADECEGFFLILTVYPPAANIKMLQNIHRKCEITKRYRMENVESILFLLADENTIGELIMTKYKRKSLKFLIQTEYIF